MVKRDEEFSEAFNKASQARRKFAPFYSAKVNQEVGDILKDMQELHNLFEYRWFNKDMETYSRQPNQVSKINNLHDAIKHKQVVLEELVRNELENLSNYE